MGSIVRAQGIFFCEGTPGSHDTLAYDQLVAPLGGAWMTQPAGGKRGLKNFVRGALGPDEGVGRLWAALRDRDLDFEPDPASIRCVERNARWRVFTTHRAEIESYLIDPRLMHRYWSAMAASGPKWRHGPSPGVDALRTQLATVGRSLVDHQAFAWTLKRLYMRHVERPWDEQKLGTLYGQPGGLGAIDFEARLHDLLAAVPNRRPPVTWSEARDLFSGYRSRFADPVFFDSELFLVWFKGKDLIQALNRTPGVIWPVAKANLQAIARDHLRLDDFPDLEAMSRMLAGMKPHGSP